jgi:Zn-finger protein
MFEHKVECRMCGTMMKDDNIGYISTSNGCSIFECKECHLPTRPVEPKPAFKSWRIFRREPNI